MAALTTKEINEVSALLRAVEELDEIAVGRIQLWDSNGDEIGAIIQEGSYKFYALPGDEALNAST